MEILRKVEARIQANFQNGLPPHLQPNAGNSAYRPGTDQSRIFVASHSDFKSLPDKDVQRILRERIILVHGNPLDYGYGWDLNSFARVYDVDKKIQILGKIHIPLLCGVFLKTDVSSFEMQSQKSRCPPLPGNIARNA